MKLQLDTNYSDHEIDFIKRNHCEILSEFKAPKDSFRETEIPRRIFRYCGTFIAEIFDSDEGVFLWSVMSTGRFRGKYIFSDCCDNLEELIQGL